MYHEEEGLLRKGSHSKGGGGALQYLILAIVVVNLGLTIAIGVYGYLMIKEAKQDLSSENLISTLINKVMPFMSPIPSDVLPLMNWVLHSNYSNVALNVANNLQKIQPLLSEIGIDIHTYSTINSTIQYLEIISNIPPLPVDNSTQNYTPDSFFGALIAGAINSTIDLGGNATEISTVANSLIKVMQNIQTLNWTIWDYDYYCQFNSSNDQYNCSWVNETLNLNEGMCEFTANVIKGCASLYNSYNSQTISPAVNTGLCNSCSVWDDCYSCTDIPGCGWCFSSYECLSMTATCPPPLFNGTMSNQTNPTDSTCDYY